MKYRLTLSDLKAPLVTLFLSLSVGYFTYFISGLFQQNYTLQLFFTAVGLSVWFGGVSQGLFGIILVILFVDYYFVGTHKGFKALSFAWTYQLILFSLNSLLMTLLIEKLFRSRKKLQKTLDAFTNTDRSLKMSENRFRKIFDSKMIGLAFGDLQGNIYEANNYFLNLVGYDSKYIAEHGLKWSQLNTSEFEESQLIDLMSGGLMLPTQKEYMRADGSRIAVLWGAAQIEENSIVQFVLNYEEHQRAQQELAEVNNRLEERVAQRTKELSESAQRLIDSGAFLDSVIENIPNMIFVKDAKDLRFVRFNRAGEILLGQSRENLLGKNDFDFFPEEQARFFTDVDRAVLKNKTLLDIPEEPIETKSGTRFLHTVKIPILDNMGTPLYLLGISEDITERKLAEKQREALFEEKIARKEAEKNAKSLAALVEAATLASRTKSAFIANMSHEIRTPHWSHARLC